MENTVTISLENSSQTEKLGASVASQVTAGDVIFLYGDLGAGKTTFSRGFVQSLGFSGAVKSPTYTIAELYELENKTIAHLDCYRLADPAELDYLGLDHWLSQQCVILVEWPDIAKSMLPEPSLIINLEYSDSTRVAEISGEKASICLTDYQNRQ